MRDLNKNVLLVGRRGDAREIAGAFPPREGWLIETVARSSDAAVEAGRRQPGLVLLECDSVDPWRDTLRRIKTRSPKSLVVLLAQEEETPAYSTALEEGADDLLVGPFAPGQLRDWFRTFYVEDRRKLGSAAEAGKT